MTLEEALQIRMDEAAQERMREIQIMVETHARDSITDQNGITAEAVKVALHGINPESETWQAFRQ
jgi:hypothetical protein